MYDPKIGAQKGGIAGAIAAVGVGLEAAVNAYFPGLLPPGVITGAVTTLGTALINYVKNRGK